MVSSSASQVPSPDATVSMSACFDGETITRHVQSFPSLSANDINTNGCGLCNGGELACRLPHLWCECGEEILELDTYYTTSVSDKHFIVCQSCFGVDGNRSRTLFFQQTTIEKCNMKIKHHKTENEKYVLCDKCEKWFHMSCGLYNPRRDFGDHITFSCPLCYVQEFEMGSHLVIPVRLTANDLPPSSLSRFLEKKLGVKLDSERVERAKQDNKLPNEVPFVESLTIRVVSVLDKSVKVQEKFCSIFGVPAEFPFKSKAIQVYQKIDGIDVLIFKFYTQEYDEHCPEPNQRRVYLAYLDSVDYLEPQNIITACGDRYSTFIYHHIMMAYMHYCKLCGFRTFHFWVAPPEKGVEYLFNAHPPRKTNHKPDPDFLLKWYLSLLTKALREGIITGRTNVHDEFLGKNRSVTLIPHFSGDYFPNELEEILKKLPEQEETNAIDQSIMDELVAKIEPKKENFIMVSLHQKCITCVNYICSGTYWYSESTNICSSCFKPDDAGKYYEKIVELKDFPEENRSSKILDSRESFLKYCIGNKFLFDTCTRAKHSSCMVLYGLHNPGAVAFVRTCQKCNVELKVGDGWTCEGCLDYDLCQIHYNEWIKKRSRLKRSVAVGHDHDFTHHWKSKNNRAESSFHKQVQNLTESKAHLVNCTSPDCEVRICYLARHKKSCKELEVCDLCEDLKQILDDDAYIFTRNALLVLPDPKP